MTRRFVRPLAEMKQAAGRISQVVSTSILPYAAKMKSQSFQEPTHGVARKTLRTRREFLAIFPTSQNPHDHHQGFIDGILDGVITSETERISFLVRDR